MKKILILIITLITLPSYAKFCSNHSGISRIKEKVSDELIIIRTFASAKYNDDDIDGPTHITEEFDLMPYPVKKAISFTCSKGNVKEQARKKCDELGGMLGKNLESETSCQSYGNIFSSIVFTFDDWAPRCDSFREDECLIGNL